MNLHARFAALGAAIAVAGCSNLVGDGAFHIVGSDEGGKDAGLGDDATIASEGGGSLDGSLGAIDEPPVDADVPDAGCDACNLAGYAAGMAICGITDAAACGLPAACGITCLNSDPSFPHSACCFQ